MTERQNPQGRRVLIAAAQAQTRSFLSVLLAEHGFEPEEAEDGPALLERLTRCPPAAAVVDESGGGTTWVRRARQAAPDIPLVLISNGQDLTPAEAAELADGYLDRPVRPDLLLFTLYRLLRRHDRCDRLRHAQRIELLGRLTGGVVHDLNNLVTVMLGHSELLLQTDPEPPACRDRPLDAVHEHASQIREAASRASSLTRRLLAFSRRETPRRVRLNLNLVIADMSRLLRSVMPAEIEVVTELDPTVENVEADVGQMEQVIMNLVLNGRDAILDRTAPDLSVGVPTGREQTGRGPLEAGAATRAWSPRAPRPSRGRLRVRTAPGELGGERAVVLAVADNGCGMTTEVRARLFEPFFTTKPPGCGTGLGMGIVADIVRECGGRIEVDSELGRGTELRIVLPAAPRLEAPREVRRRRSDSPGRSEGSRTVLVVEDNNQVAELTGTVLRDCGYTVLMAHDGVRAMQLGSAEPRLDLLVTDLGLPGMNGHTIAEQLCAARPGLKVLFISGEVHPEPANGRLDGPLLEKPFTPDDLIERVRAVLAGEN